MKKGDTALDRLSGPARAMADDLVQQETMNAIRLHGIEAALAMPKHDAAIHEAGHAIIFAVQGRRLEYLELFEQSKFRRRRELEQAVKRNPDKMAGLDAMTRILALPAWQGWTCPEKLPEEIAREAHFIPHERPEWAERHVRWMIGGLMAELVLHNGNVSLASSIDEKVTAQMVCSEAWRDDGVRHWARIATDVTATLRQHWPVALEIAALLEVAPPLGHVQHRLDGGKLDSVLRPLYPAPVGNKNAA
jgi:hypothetical protein